MKIGFVKRKDGVLKEDITRAKERNPKYLLGGLALIAALLAGIAAAGVKVGRVFKKQD